MSGGKGSNLFRIGDLEATILAAVWDLGGKVTVKEVYEKILPDRGAAYTTVMTVMGNLTRKGLLKQDRTSPAFRYEATKTRKEILSDFMAIVRDKFYDGDQDQITRDLNGDKEP